MIAVTFKTRPTRELCFDLENRPSAYWYDGETTSEITAIGWKWADEPEVRTLLLRRDDRYVSDDGKLFTPRAAFSYFQCVLEDADLVYGHNIRKHDLPMFSAHLLRAGLPVLAPVRTTDTLRDYPRRGGMSASLANLAAMYGLDGEKLQMTQTDWENANRLKKDGIALARERVASDVLLQEQLRGKLLELGLLKRPRMWAP